ncbi:hypothetical protein PHISP_07464 [Aspergillus sp. HF37]|uniref:Uncharacterized protein n=1 Tax=Aspergillus sclerotialis TaxID=2070753 RepID=A0A3A2ZHF3_9EURO|nr:hypothetical protein PHISCL_10338 [Aspergillus sclerotialis]RMJ21661.1 hypothetical protein PHISP_07464 [Aspergillus sp. HF37]
MDDPVAPGKLRIINRDVDKFSDGLVNIRTVINVFSYLNFPHVHNQWTTIANDIRAELKRANDTWVANGKSSTHIAEYWDKWIRSHLNLIAANGLAFTAASIQEMRNNWRNYGTSVLVAEVLLSLNILERQLSLITVNMADLR